MTSFALKIIAITAMLIDHVGVILFPELFFLRIIGRAAFPIFVFLSAEACRKTRSMPKYLLRLFIFALLSELPFDLAFYRTVCYPEYQNVFFTLFLGVAAVYLYRIMDERAKGNLRIFAYIAPVACALAAAALMTDYGAVGVLMIFFAWRLGEGFWPFAAVIIAGNLIFSFVNFYSGGGFDGYWQMAAGFALLPVALYKKERGWPLKYAFYVFYPAHLLVLYLLSLPNV